ncbi:MAG TPA: hypothetical protein DEP72_01450 [Clostridiales bacterium]|nr:MAG: hypothetical protein A2Y18_05185 [Clostridiales bacterium GWD2_32_19]HCC06819.1 hypothetical protein [Clostridiales bacterium]
MKIVNENDAVSSKAKIKRNVDEQTETTVFRKDGCNQEIVCYTELPVEEMGEDGELLVFDTTNRLKQTGELSKYIYSDDLIQKFWLKIVPYLAVGERECKYFSILRFYDVGQYRLSAYLFARDDEPSERNDQLVVDFYPETDEVEFSTCEIARSYQIPSMSDEIEEVKEYRRVGTQDEWDMYPDVEIQHDDEGEIQETLKEKVKDNEVDREMTVMFGTGLGASGELIVYPALAEKIKSKWKGLGESIEGQRLITLENEHFLISAETKLDQDDVTKLAIVTYIKVYFVEREGYTLDYEKHEMMETNPNTEEEQIEMLKISFSRCTEEHNSRQVKMWSNFCKFKEDNTTKKCNGCGQEFDEEMYVSELGNTYCEDCLGEFNTMCKVCEKVLEKPDMYAVDGKYICKECYNKPHVKQKSKGRSAK